MSDGIGCPFCGGSANTVSENGDGFAVRCFALACGARGPVGGSARVAGTMGAPPPALAKAERMRAAAKRRPFATWRLEVTDHGRESGA